MERKTGFPSSFARAKASSPQGYQSTGLWECWSRYGDFSFANLFGAFFSDTIGPHLLSKIWLDLNSSPLTVFGRGFFISPSNSLFQNSDGNTISCTCSPLIYRHGFPNTFSWALVVYSEIRGAQWGKDIALLKQCFDNPRQSLCSRLPILKIVHENNGSLTVP